MGAVPFKSQRMGAASVESQSMGGAVWVTSQRMGLRVRAWGGGGVGYEPEDGVKGQSMGGQCG
jgi:hypothetical protein